MERYTYTPSVTAGHKSIRLSREEAQLAVFTYAYNRAPTADEMKRLGVCVFDRPTDPDKEWTLVLTVNDKQPVLARDDKGELIVEAEGGA